MAEKLKEALNQQPVREAVQSMTHVEELNVNEPERFLSLLCGIGLTLVGVLRHSRSSIVWLLAGGYLIFRGVTGYCLLYRLFGFRSVSRTEQRQFARGEQFP